MNAQLDLDFRARRDAGMARARDHAEADVPGWGDHAYALLHQYALDQRMPWTCEAFRPWAYDRGLPVPANERAWGPVVQRAIRAGLIERVGYAPAASSNGSPKATYRWAA